MLVAPRGRIQLYGTVREFPGGRVYLEENGRVVLRQLRDSEIWPLIEWRRRDLLSGVLLATPLTGEPVWSLVGTLLGLSLPFLMAHATTLTNLAANTHADAVVALMNSGKLRIYDGAQPATADTAVGAQALLAELTFNATAGAAASGGVVTFNAITSDTSANATGTATWFRILKSDSTTMVMDGNVGTSGCDLNLTTTSIVATTTVAITAGTYTAKKV